MFETRFNKSHSISKNLLLIKGLGKSTISIICKALGINPRLRLKALSKTHTDQLYTFLSKLKKQSHLDYVLQDIPNIQPGGLLKACSDSSSDLGRSALAVNNFSFIREQLSNQTIDDINDTLIFLTNKKATYTYNSAGNRSTAFSSKSAQRGLPSPLLDNTLDRNIIIDESLEEYVKTNITSLVETNTYRGRRLKLGYPSRGQRTRTNARTARRLNKRLVLKNN